PSDLPQVDERWADSNVCGGLVRHAKQQPFDQLGVLRARAVHLPVSGDKGPAHRTTSFNCGQARPRRRSGSTLERPCEGRGSLATQPRESKYERSGWRMADRQGAGAPVRLGHEPVNHPLSVPPPQAACAAEATLAASSLASSRTSFSSLPSTMTRMTGSVPEGRSTIRPDSPSRACARATAS